MAEVPMDTLPGNSKKSQAQNAGPGEGGKPDIPVFGGETRQVKRNTGGFLRWLRKMFLSDRKPSEIMKEIVEYKIVPGIKDNFRNSAMATLDSFIYPGGGPTSGGSTNGVNYNRIYSGNTHQEVRTPDKKETKQDEINKGFCNPSFRTQNEAMEFLAMMKNYDYPTLSVHTLYMMQKQHIDYTWDAYGWNREEILALNTGSIKHITGDPRWPWMIDLPEAHVIT